MDPGPID